MTQSEIDIPPVLTFEGDKYHMDSLPDDVKELLTAMQVADSKIKDQESTLRLLVLARQTMVASLKQKLSSIKKLN